MLFNKYFPIEKGFEKQQLHLIFRGVLEAACHDQ
jgi:hypothetical protein